MKLKHPFFHHPLTKSGNFLACTTQQCFACDRNFSTRSFHYEARTSDGQRVCVGFDCGKKIAEAGDAGYQPLIGGPRLFSGWPSEGQPK